MLGPQPRRTPIGPDVLDAEGPSETHGEAERSAQDLAAALPLPAVEDQEIASHFGALTIAKNRARRLAAARVPSVRT